MKSSGAKRVISIFVKLSIIDIETSALIMESVRKLLLIFAYIYLQQYPSDII